MQIERKSLERLGWHKVLELVSEYALTEPGQYLIQELAKTKNWAINVSQANRLQKETNAVATLLSKNALWEPLRGLANPNNILESLSKGSILETEDLGIVRGWLSALDNWVNFPLEELTHSLLKDVVKGLYDPASELKRLEHCIAPDGSIEDRASNRLKGLREKFRQVQEKIGSKLEDVKRDYLEKGYLQEDISDRRDNRFVLAVKAGCQSKVNGMVYDQSVSKQTVYVEPREVEVLNNELRQIHSEIKQEEFAILRDLSDLLRPSLFDFGKSFLTMIYWDGVYAKARFASQYGGREITVTEERVFSLHQTAHPLLWWSLEPQEIIRNNVEFGPDCLSLFISGPNTGGKTVILKTLGLASIFAKTGLLFPGAGDQKVPFFEKVFVDIGDPQDIDEHLSSFSGHVVFLKELLGTVSPNCFILFDEMNSSTDPEEGAALYKAFLKYLNDQDLDVMLVATTHDPKLKAFSIEEDYIETAAMEFSEEELEPTYKLIVGLPGRSRALETAKRLGLQADLIEQAKSYVDEGQARFDELLASLEKERVDLEKKRKAVDFEKEQVERAKAKWIEKKKEVVEENLDLYLKKLRSSLREAQDEIKGHVRRAIESSTLKRVEPDVDRKFEEIESKLKQRAKSYLGEQLPELSQAIESEKIEHRSRLLPIEVGVWVRVPKWKSHGIIEKIDGNKLTVKLKNQHGGDGLTIHTHRSDVETLYAEEQDKMNADSAKQKKERVEIRNQLPDEIVARELDLRGVRLEEAMNQLETYLDQAYRAQHREVRIIHGLGTGAIRENARKLLETLPYIKLFRDGAGNEGGAGATVVEFEIQ